MKLCVLLAHYRGQDQLSEQMDSLAHQTLRPDMVLIGNDDGEVPTVWPGLQLQVVQGPRRGAAANFLALAAQAPEAEFYAFADQDDVWLPDKLARAVAQLETLPPQVPALYGSATLYIDVDGHPCGRSRTMPRAGDFGNSLVQCGAGGNTMVFNRAAMQLLRQMAAPCTEASHDWLLYAAVLGCGGRFLYDPEPGVLYRQHGANLRGGNQGLRARWLRLRGLFDGTFRERLEAQAQALAPLEHALTPTAGQQWARFQQARRAQHALARLQSLWASAAWRQSGWEQLALWLAALCRRL